jgi:hypothetical protein
MHIIPITINHLYLHGMNLKCSVTQLTAPKQLHCFIVDVLLAAAQHFYPDVPDSAYLVYFDDPIAPDYGGLGVRWKDSDGHRMERNVSAGVLLVYILDGREVTSSGIDFK